MGIIRQGILGGLSGKVGNVVGASWKGIDYLRALPSQVANPKTIPQRTNRGKLSKVVKFLRSCTALVRIGFGGFAVRMSAFNAATSYNLLNAAAGTYPDIVLDYGQLSISKGNLPGAVNAAAGFSEPNMVEFSWDDNSTSGMAKADDTAMVLVYNPAKGASVFRHNAGTRSQEILMVEVPEEWTDDDVHCYIAFYDTTRTAGTRPKDFSSETAYAGMVTV